MLDAATVDELASLDSGGTPVLSVYLGLDPARQVRRSYRIAFEGLVRDARGRLEGPVREAFVQETARGRAWLEGWDPRGRGLGLFSWPRRGLGQTHVLSGGGGEHLAFRSPARCSPPTRKFSRRRSRSSAVSSGRGRSCCSTSCSRRRVPAGGRPAASPRRSMPSGSTRCRRSWCPPASTSAGSNARTAGDSIP